MLPINAEISWRKSRVLSHVSFEIFGASVKSAMQLGTVKYSGRLIRAGFCVAAFRIAVLAAVRFSSSVRRISMWSTLTFNVGPCLVVLCIGFG